MLHHLEHHLLQPHPRSQLTQHRLLTLEELPTIKLAVIGTCLTEQASSGVKFGQGKKLELSIKPPYPNLLASYPLPN